MNQIGDWRDVLRPRLMAGLFERGRTILGEPGLGKSSLVRRIADDASAHGDWVTPQIRIALGTDPIARLAAELLVLAKKAGLPASREAKIGTLLKRVQTVSAGAAGVSANVTLREGSAEDAHVTLAELLAEIGRAAITQGKVVLIHLDEVQNIDDDNALSQVLVALGDAITRSVTVTVPGVGDVERSLPIAVYLTGLPEFDDASDTRKGATFARRFKVVLLQPLTDDDLRSALSLFISPGWEVPLDVGELGTVHMEPAAIERIISACQGEPFLFQLAGERAWYAGTSSLISEADVERGWNEARGVADDRSLATARGATGRRASRVVRSRSSSGARRAEAKRPERAPRSVPRQPRDELCERCGLRRPRLRGRMVDAGEVG